MFSVSEKSKLLTVSLYNMKKIKELYTLVDFHFETSKEHTEGNEIIPDLLKIITEIYEKRQRILQKVLEEINPRKIFCEGTKIGHPLPLENIKYEIIFLDENVAPYEIAANGLENIYKKYHNLILENALSNLGEKIKVDRHKLAQLLLQQQREIEEYHERHYELIGRDRELYWYEKILKNFEQPSCLICGAGHITTGPLAIKLLPAYLYHLGRRGFGVWSSQLNDSKKGKIAILPDLLSSVGIKIRLKGYLPSISIFQIYKLYRSS